MNNVILRQSPRSDAVSDAARNHGNRTEDELRGSENVQEALQAAWLQQNFGHAAARNPAVFREALTDALGADIPHYVVDQLIDSARAGDLSLPHVQFISGKDAARIGATRNILLD